MNMTLPTLPKNRTPATLPEQDRLMPLAIGAGLLAAGALLWRAKPSVLQIPDPLPFADVRRPNALQRALRKSRNGVDLIAPRNLGVALGRSMVVAGTALIITRVLDELGNSHR